MAIDALNSRVYKSGVKESVATAKNVAQDPKGNVASKETVSKFGSDSVVLTNTAQILTKGTQKAKESSGVDSAKVEKLKNAIKDGSYKIDYESVANKLIDSEDELSSIFG